MNHGNHSQHDRVVDSSPLIVGVGASAGGLEAFQELLTALGNTPGLAIVFVQHLDPHSQSLLVELLSQSTSMDVIEITDGIALTTNTVYVCPAQKLLELHRGSVRILNPDEKIRRISTIDHFLHSIAEDQRDRGLGIILSGTGSDGTLGLKAISDRGGLTFAQDQASAKYDAMPQSAATAGVADHVMPPREIAAELLRYARHLRDQVESASPVRLQEQIEAAIPVIAEMLMKATSHNFQHYKSSTLQRRIQRRMQMLKTASVEAYLAHLQQNENELQALFRDLLIGVTAFFRDPEVFAVLRNQVLPSIFENRDSNDPVRIWVAGCANGSEAYTMAILCREVMDNIPTPPEVQVFATDIDERSLAIARNGKYPLGIQDHISPERLQRFFVKQGQQYHVTKELRELVLFSQHNLISDPPFSRLDLISCRNLLIYLGPHLQKKLIPLFHYALRPAGYLLLGPSESIVSHGELFRPIDVKSRISQRKGTAIGSATPTGFQPRAATSSQAIPIPGTPVDLTEMMQRIALDEFTPKTAVINESGQVLTSSPNIKKYLNLTTGPFENNIVKMAASGLQIGLRAAISEAKRTSRRVQHDHLSLHDGDQVQRVMLTVQPMPRLGEDEPLFLVVFHDVGLPIQRDGHEALTPHAHPDTDSLILQMENELATTRSDLERMMQDTEATNEELKSSNEELLSMNEELHSTNEELETSREEIRASRDAIANINSDLENLFRSTQIATICLDNNQNTLWYSPAAAQIYRLIATDIGRPLSDISHVALKMPAIPDAEDLSGDHVRIEDEIETNDGRWFLRRVLPYMRGDKADGMILTFIDITLQKQSTIRMATEHQVIRLLAEAKSFDTVVPKVLNAIRETLGADICAIWLPDAQHQTLRCTDASVWPNDAKMEQVAVQNQEFEFTKGQGLPGRVWQSLTAQSIEKLAEDTDFSRTHAIAAGLTQAMAMPIVVGTDFFGVIEIFSRHPGRYEQPFLAMLQSMGIELGQFIRHTQADANLRDEEARKSAILASALDSIITMDVDGRIVDFNPAAESTFGYKQHEVKGRLLAEAIIPEELREAHTRGLNRYLASGESTIIGRRVEVTAQRSNGEIFPVELAINATKSRDGSPFFTAYLRDITEHKQFVQTIFDRDERIVALLNSTAEGIYGITPEGVCTFANASCGKLLGYADPDELVGKHMHSLIHHTRRDGTTCEHDECHIYDAFRVGAQVHIDDDIFWRSDGTPFDVEYWSYPMIRDGQTIGCVVTFLDVTHRKEAEQIVVNQREDLELAFRAGRLGSWKWNISEDRVTWSDHLYALLGYSKDQFTATCAGFLQIIHPDDRDYVQSRIDAMFSGSCEEFEMDFRVYRGDNRQVIWTYGRGVIDRDAHGKPLSITAVASDVSERKKSELDLIQRERTLSLALDAGRMGSWVWDIPKNQITWSDRLHVMYGYDKDAFKGTPAGFVEIVHPEDHGIVEQVIDSVLHSKSEREEFEVRCIRGTDGRVIWTQIHGVVDRDKHGNALRITGFAVDITERKQRELNLAFLANLQSFFVNSLSADEIIREACSRIVNYLQLSRCLLAEIDEQNETANVFYEHPADNDLPSMMGRHPLADFHHDQERIELLSGHPIAIDDCQSQTRPAESVKHFAACNIGALFAATYISGRRLKFVLAAIQSEPHHWQEDEQEFLQDFASRVYVRLERARAEDALRDSEEFNRTIIESSPDCINVLDLEGRILTMNTAGIASFEISEFETWRDKPWESLWPTESHPSVRQALTDTLAGGTGNFQAFCPTANGTPKWWDVIVTSVRGVSDQIKFLVAVSRDITEQKRWELELADREAHLRRVINNQLGLVGVIGPDGKLLEVDDRSMSIAGLSRDDVIGKHFAECAWWTYDDSVANQMRDAMERGFAGETVRFDVGLFSKQGAPLMIDFMMAPAYDAHGNIEYLIPSGVDISDRYAAQMRLIDSERRMSMALKAGNMAAWEWTPEKSIWENSLFELLGIPRQENPSSDLFFRSVHPDDAPALRSIWSAATEKGENYETEFRIIRPNGDVIWLAAVGTIICNEQGDITRMHGLNWDTTDKKESERRILASEERLRLALSAAELKLWQWHVHADEFYRAGELSEYSGLESAKPIGGLDAFLDLVHPDDQHHVEQALRDSLEKGTPYRCEYRIRRSSKAYRWVMSLAHLSLKDSQSPLQMIGIELDITTRRESEEAIKSALENYESSNTKLQGIFDVTLIFVGVIDLDGNVSEVNEAATTGCGYTRDQVIGKKFWEGPWWRRSAKVRNSIRESFQRAVAGETLEMELDYSVADNSKRTVQFRIAPARNEKGEVMFVVPSGVDITERKHNEREIRLSAQRLSVAAKSAGFGMLHVDLRTQKVLFSPEFKRIVGYPADHAFKLEPSQTPSFVYPEDVSAYQNHFQQATQTRRQPLTPLDLRIIRRDGKLRWVRLQTKTLWIKDNEGNKRPSQIIGTLLDITNQHEFEQSLKEARLQAVAANESKSAFLANMSHEIRTPMTAILGYADLIAEKVNDDETLAHVRTIRRNGGFLLDIINDILDLSKIEAGKFEISQQRFAPNHLVEDVRSIMEVRAAESNLELEVEYRGKIPAEIISDPKRLKQILINLVGNAIKFTPAGTVKIIVHYVDEPTDAGWLRIEIVDSGIGISQQQQQRLFQPFSQGDGNVNREFGGTGLGLAISKRLTEMLGGEISVKSELGKGSTFTVTIATGDIAGVQKIHPQLTTQPPPNATPAESVALDCHVLVVDDRRDIRFLSKSLLKKAGAKVDEAEDGEVAIRMVETMISQGRSYDLILLDMQMPRLDGYQTAEQLRKLGFSGPIIALTADAMQGDMTRCIDSGCNDYLSKPINVERLTQMVYQFTHK
ncbi:Autoinducer 2 sensor kinase/phosphatase LuxQ [Novipirellula galeiformis]|uniref:Autoinducer 2 sensor kinase/phosphatase LuxQ n=1 Tax=Novipirellula galeiformis TaxID=2528004 RepID=A0A5C6CF08_9BACT|nr:PAS domain S-box protein [Novipirellula galeiformis]TWU22327.1 Autoinducer 2 sensor kinase/phosphatase LuxQ [Novipirellula galeiformis]